MLFIVFLTPTIQGRLGDFLIIMPKLMAFARRNYGNVVITTILAPPTRRRLQRRWTIDV